MAGITFDLAKPVLCTVTDNGIDQDDPRVMVRTNEAMQVILSQPTIPVNGMMTTNILAQGQVLLLPPEMKNIIDVTVLSGGTVRGDADNTQGFYDIVNQFTYIDPSMAHDNPLEDNGLVPDPNDATVLRRQYTYPGLTNGAMVQATGAKAYVPITQGTDFLIVQNLEAVKQIILSIERYENNDAAGGANYRQLGLGLIESEVKGFLLDPRNVMRRKADYEDDLVAYPPGSFAWTRARIALEVPGAMMYGKSEITRILDQAEMRLMEGRLFRGCIKEYSAEVVAGIVYFPKDVDAILGADYMGMPLDIRSILFKYLENGPGSYGIQMFPNIEDLGEEYFSTSKNTRRKFCVHVWSDTEPRTLTIATKVRWVKKQPADQLTIKHYEALRLMATGIVLERQEKWQEAIANEQQAINELQGDLDSYLKGIKHTLPVQMFGFGMGDVGGML
jgi:hypothetical protein